MKSYKFRFYPNRLQEIHLAQEFGNARFIWNWALNRKKAVYAETDKYLSFKALSAEATQ